MGLSVHSSLHHLLLNIWSNFQRMVVFSLAEMAHLDSWDMVIMIPVVHLKKCPTWTLCLFSKLLVVCVIRLHWLKVLLFAISVFPQFAFDSFVLALMFELLILSVLDFETIRTISLQKYGVINQNIAVDATLLVEIHV